MERISESTSVRAIRLRRVRYVPERMPSPFSRILCALDESRNSDEAMHQAIALSAAGATLTFAAVVEGEAEEQARALLEQARSVAAQAEVDASVLVLRGKPADALLLDQAAKHDLLVAGAHRGSRLGGALSGKTAVGLVHHTEMPLLIARRSLDGRDFPHRILLASDGSPGSWGATRMATRLAQARDSELRFVYVPDGMHPEHYRGVREQLQEIEKELGGRPELVAEPGPVVERIGEVALASQASLVVVGRRGRRLGIASLGSVSERVVQKSPCSVLVAPTADRRG